jgi:hypothetical protein
METQQEACSAQRQLRISLDRNPNRFAALSLHCHACVMALSTVVDGFTGIIAVVRALAALIY